MSLEAFSQNLRVALTDLPHLPARFFWLRSFGEQSSVSWEAFLTAFLADYQNENVGDNTENTEKKLLCSEVIDHFQEVLRIVMQKQQSGDTQHTNCEQNKEVHQLPPVPLRATLPNGDSSGDDTVMLPDIMIDNSTEEHTAEKLQEDNVKCSAVTEDKVDHVEFVPEVLSSPPEPHAASQDQSMSKSNEDRLLVLAKGDQFDHIHNSVTVDEPLPSFQITMNGFATFCGRCGTHVVILCLCEINQLMSCLLCQRKVLPLTAHFKLRQIPAKFFCPLVSLMSLYLAYFGAC